MRSWMHRLSCLPMGMLAVVLLTSMTGCGAFEPPPPPPPFKAIIFVEGDPGHKLAGATVARGGTTVATTGLDGRAEVVVNNAQEGTSFDASVACPAGHTNPSKPISVKVTRTGGERWPEFNVRCTPTRPRGAP